MRAPYRRRPTHHPSDGVSVRARKFPRSDTQVPARLPARWRN